MPTSRWRGGRATAITGAQQLAVVETDPAVDGRWDRYVRGNPRGLVYHLAAWARILSATYRFKVRYLALEASDRELHGVLPLLYKRGPVSGARLRSLPVVPRAGPLADDAAQERRLMSAACGLVHDRAQLVVTTGTAGFTELPGVACRPGLPRWVVALGGQGDRYSWRRRSRNPGRGVRRSELSGVRVREGSSEADLRAFYRLYLRTQRRLRAVPRGYRQLSMSRALLAGPGIFKLFLAEYRERTVAGVVWHAYGGQLEGLYYGGDERYLDVRPNHALYAHALDWALAHGFREVDLGGAPEGSPLAYFKSQWGAEPVPLYFYVYPAHAAPPDPRQPPDPAPVEIGKVGWLERAWKLTPLPLVRLAGGIAYRYL